MAQKKLRFTIWLNPAALEIAKARALEDRVSISETLAQAATEALLASGRHQSEAKVLQAVERVFHLIQRIDRRRGFDNQVLKEMLGLSVLSFFNHTPAVPSADKKAALLDGKARFNRFLDALAANLRAGKSILADLPIPEDDSSMDNGASQKNQVPVPMIHQIADGNGGQGDAETVHHLAVEHRREEQKPPAQRAKPEHVGSHPSETKKRWSLFG
ncbi:MAG TPA: hypothetical protein VMU69_20155 [Bradyrhizobium sp.]|nr:hypothetical protein [Bradyrhizobium sp.]